MSKSKRDVTKPKLKLLEFESKLAKMIINREFLVTIDAILLREEKKWHESGTSGFLATTYHRAGFKLLSWALPTWTTRSCGISPSFSFSLNPFTRHATILFQNTRRAQTLHFLVLIEKYTHPSILRNFIINAEFNEKARSTRANRFMQLHAQSLKNLSLSSLYFSRNYFRPTN